MNFPYFVCKSSPCSLKPTRWIAHDWNNHFAGEFESEEEAKQSVENWNTKGGNLITLEWIPPHPDADDSNRGTYVIHLASTNFRLRICCGWHSEEIAGERLKLMRNAITKWGYDAVNEILFASQDKFTKHGWNSGWKT